MAEDWLGIPPEVSEYQDAAAQQAASSQANVAAQTAANRPNQTNAFGASTQWTHNPDGSWTQSQNLSPEMQGIMGGLGQQMRDAYSQPFDNGSAARQQAIDSAYGQATSRLNPQWDQRQEQMSAQLANQGLDPNSEAFRTALRQFGQDRNDAYSSAMNGAIGQGNQAQALTFAQNMAARNMPGQEMSALQGFLSMPQFVGAGAADPLNALGAAAMQGNYNLDAYGKKTGAEADAISGIMSPLNALTSFIPKL
jgi:hypothetical protein